MQRPEVPGLRGLLASLRALHSSAAHTPSESLAALGRHLYRMLRQRGRAAHLGTPPRRAIAVRLRRGRARGGVEQLRNGVPRRLQGARRGAVPAAGGASRAPRPCARRRMRGRGGWAWGRASGRAVSHGAVCSRVSPPSSVAQVHASRPLASAGPGVWKRSRWPVGSGRGRAHARQLAGPGVCVLLCQTLSSVGRSGAQARACVHASRSLDPTGPHCFLAPVKV
mmetsp:Transcript_7077/g.22386  ORF Transcript_7077/g.22386 Transcript_7077/m.22386 type:complete len:224 (-) Transcript_7077:31-702(-)